MAVPSGPVTASTDVEAAMFDFVDAYDRAYEIAAHQHELSVANACVLGRLADDRGMGELADELGCDASNITQIVRRLESRGLVDRYASPEDRRSRRIARTQAGATVYAAFEQSFEFAKAAVQRLDDAEQEELARLLRKALPSDVPSETPSGRE